MCGLLSTGVDAIVSYGLDAALELVKLANEVRRLLDYYKAIVTLLQPQRIAYRLGFVPKTYLFRGEAGQAKGRGLRSICRD